MVIHQALLDATQQLRAAQISQPRLEANLLLQYVLHMDRMGLLRRQNEELSAEATAQYREVVARRCDGEPTAYILGNKEFMSLSFQVSPAVLIPRPDTEILCEAVVEKAQAFVAPRILDVCCGSGCIGISLAHYIPSAQVTLVDISTDALAVARKNAARLAPENTCVTEGDAFGLAGVYDFIVSNPPYIETEVVKTLQTEVRAHEPHLALDGGADGLRFYRHFAKSAQNNLQSGGVLALEVGHTQAQTVADLLEANGWDRIEIRNDLAGIARVVLGYKK